MASARRRFRAVALVPLSSRWAGTGMTRSKVKQRAIAALGQHDAHGGKRWQVRGVGHFCCHHALNSSYGIASGVALIAPLIPTTVRSGSSLQGQQKVTANLAMVTGRPSGNLNSRVSRWGGVNGLLGGAPFGAGRGAACGVGRSGAAAGATRGAACAAFAAAWLVARRRCCF